MENIQTIKASEFKAKCLKIMDEVAETGKSIIITKNGKEVAKIVPVKPKVKSLYGLGKGKIKILGDIISPIDTEWEVLS